MARGTAFELISLFLLSFVQTVPLIIVILSENHGTIFSLPSWQDCKMAVVNLWLWSGLLQSGPGWGWLAEVLVLRVTDQGSVRELLTTHRVVTDRAPAVDFGIRIILSRGIGAP